MTLLLSFAFAGLIHGDDAELEFLGAGLAVEGDLRLHGRGHVRPVAGRTLAALHLVGRHLATVDGLFPVPPP